MEVVTILILLVLNIILPTLDTVTDINLVFKLFRGATIGDCKFSRFYESDYEKCLDDLDY